MHRFNARYIALTGAVVVGVIAASLSAGSAAGAQEGAAVPNRFSKVYNALDEQLRTFNGRLDRRETIRRDVVLGGEVLPANSHRGEGLLTDEGFKGSVLFVDRLKELGAGGVSVQMAYPILNDNFPRSKEYWDFYKRLAEAIRERGLKLHVKSGPIFADRAFSDLETNYGDVTVDSYFRDRMRIAQRIAAEIRPDYLSIGNEPSSEMQIFKFKVTGDRYVAFINETLRGMSRGRTLVGAGSGNWDSTEYVTRFANDTDLDFIDLHIYPLASPRDNYLDRAVEMADIARRARKRLIIGEAWLYKASPQELRGNPTASAVFARDPHAFWAPLDIEFLETMQTFARKSGVEYISPFWTKYFFAYLDAKEVPALAGHRRMAAAADRKMVGNLLAKRYSATGNAYRRLAGN